MPLDLFGPFRPLSVTAHRIGMETEFATLRRDTGLAAAYGGPTGTKRLLTTIADAYGGTPIMGPQGPVGLELDDGSKITLEACGAFEYATAPGDDLVSVAAQMDTRMRQFAGHADELGLALVAGGNVPFDTLDTVEWIPDEHVRLMKGFCERGGAPGTATLEVSALALSTQTTLDQGTPEQLRQRVRVGFSAAAIVAALFVNSPLSGGAPSGLLSWRMGRLLAEDERRFGYPPFAMNEDISVADYVAWLRGLPFIHLMRDGRATPAPDGTFDELLADGAPLNEDDWRVLTSQAWPFARLRNTLELRLSDGLTHDALMAAPALWTGLLYDAESLAAAWELTRGGTVADHRRTVADVARRGLAAQHRGRPVRELARELLDLAGQGLKRRGGAVRDLDPLHEVLAEDETYAERLLRRWHGDLDRRPERFVAAYAVPMY